MIHCYVGKHKSRSFSKKKDRLIILVYTVESYALEYGDYILYSNTIL